MKRQRIQLNLNTVPESIRPLLVGVPVFDSSCSEDARVFFVDRDDGFYLKTASAGMLTREAEMTRFFHRKGLAADVLAFESGDADWLVTARIDGEDCLDSEYLGDPPRLCDTLAGILRMLHSTDCTGCPVVSQGCPDLKTDTLIHGDFCLPNVMLRNWRFSGFLDLGAAGAGDRHTDLYWALWSLNYNLKTDRWRDRFLDAYGRTDVNEDLLRLVAGIENHGN